MLSGEQVPERMEGEMVKRIVVHGERMKKRRGREVKNKLSRKGWSGGKGIGEEGSEDMLLGGE